MVKFMFHKPDGPDKGAMVIGLGLSSGNLSLLALGRPILVKLEELVPNMRGEILIFAGSTEAAMYEVLKDKIGPDTEIKADTTREHL